MDLGAIIHKSANLKGNVLKQQKRLIQLFCIRRSKIVNRTKDTIHVGYIEVVQMHRWATVGILHTGSHCQKPDMEN